MNQKSQLNKIDWLTLILVILFPLLGLLNIFSSEYNGTTINIFEFKSNFSKQIIWVSLSFIILIIILSINARLFINFSYGTYGVILFLLLITLILGKVVAGSKSWIELGGFSIQPSEFAKFGTALAIAKYLETYKVNVSRFKDSILAFLIIGFPVGMIVLQNDYGSALVFVAFVFVLFRQGLPPLSLYLPLWFCILFISVLLFNKFWIIGILVIISLLFYLMIGRRLNIFILIAGLAISVAFTFSVDYVFQEVLKPHQQSRINVLLGKEIDLKGSGYNVHQSLIAIGSGGITGKGFLNGTQTKFNFIPEQSTDFIFCTIAEEYGIIGSVVLIGLFSTLILRIIYLSEKQKSRFTRIYGYGVASIIFLHFVINIAMTIGLFPVIGIPLPFISYGGSSILGFTILIGIFLKLDASYKYYFT